MAKQKRAKYKCKECGLVMIVEEPCDCERCDVVCCGVPMKEVETSRRVENRDLAKRRMAEIEKEKALVRSISGSDKWKQGGAY